MTYLQYLVPPRPPSSAVILTDDQNRETALAPRTRRIEKRDIHLLRDYILLAHLTRILAVPTLHTLIILYQE